MKNVYDTQVLCQHLNNPQLHVDHLGEYSNKCVKSLITSLFDPN